VSIQKKLFNGIWLSIACASTLGMLGCASPQPVKPTEHWQKMARTDLDAVRQLIVEAHPGMLDEQNPDFRKWVDSGYEKAAELIPGVFSYDTALAAVRYYVTGFRDGHLIYSDNIRDDTAQMFTTGWRVDLTGGDYRVVAIAPSWPTALPPIGAKLMGCDGRTPDIITQQDVAPFSDLRDLAMVRKSLASLMMNLYASGRELKRCQFRNADGTVLELSVSYQSATPNRYWEWFVTPLPGKRPRRTNDFEFSDGVLWIYAVNFNLNPQDVAGLETMLTALRSLKGARAVVFDTRGNNGGDSGVGARILSAATGGLEFDREGIEQLPRTYAQWRVSNVAIANAAERLSSRIGLYGGESQQAKDSLRHADELIAAKNAGRHWIEQSGGNLVTREDVARRGGHLVRFAGKVAVITDMNCASACLDFADYVRLVPGAVHVGQVTSADSVYIDTAFVELPSGNGGVIPLKVWRNRIRGNNEPLTPDVPIDLDSLDEPSIKVRVLDVLKTMP
jgi:hypothetical protein